MNRLAIILLAATALASAGAAFGQSTVQPPVKWEDTPNARLRVPATPVRPAPAPGVSWQQPVPAPQVRTKVAPAPRPMPQVRTQVAPATRPMTQAAPAPRAVAPVVPHVRVAPAPHAAPAYVEMRRHHATPHGSARTEMHHGPDHGPIVHGGQANMQRDVIIRRGEDRMIRHGINRYPHYRRIDRGFTVPQYWWGPRFHVMNWGQYGLPQPMHGGRWVRYYDDALLVDGYGRVHDGRWGMRWDEYEDQWDYDDRGIPVYAGNGDYYPDDRDYDWERDRGPRGEYGHDGRGYGYPAHPGYGYGGMVVTETTVTTSPTVIEETVYEDVVESGHSAGYGARHKGRRIGAKKRCAC